MGRYNEFICGIISLEILIEGLQVEERRYWAERKYRGDKLNCLNGLTECLFELLFGVKEGGAVA